MRYAVLIVVIFMACNSSETKETSKVETDSIPGRTSTPVVVDPVTESTPKDTSTSKVYSNARFRNVTVQKVGNNSYRVKGEGQIFEANFSWVVEDGHDELAKGHQMTDAGAPEWGNFDYTIKVSKKRENSTLHLILFEISAKDGSRQHELHIPLN